MPKVRIKVRPSGLINGREWPKVGEVLDLPAVVVESMGDALEPVKAEKPADKAEKRPASRKRVETREG
ncbi:MAG TPA: hypothetical protein VIR15_07100 [Intrasporangium sp.]|uniref:hypothetical protein n=1 Tax=Intrasporangium sp. TaxID=1925024 RepID=UPI002F950238